MGGIYRQICGILVSRIVGYKLIVMVSLLLPSCTLDTLTTSSPTPTNWTHQILISREKCRNDWLGLR